MTGSPNMEPKCNEEEMALNYAGHVSKGSSRLIGWRLQASVESSGGRGSAGKSGTIGDVAS